MQKTKMIKTISIVLAVAIVAGVGTTLALSLRDLGAVNNKLPDFPVTPAEGNSWEYWEDERYDNGEIVELDWYVNASTFRYSGQGTKVTDIILEKTGCKINFETPVKDDGDKLATMIAGNKLPSIVTLNVSDLTRINLAEEGYMYSVTDMAERWAPNFSATYSSEIQTYFAASDGDLYGLPHLYYTEDDMDSYSDDMGGHLLPNTAFLARKDCLDWYEKNYPEKDPSTPDGFLEMCLTVKNNCPYYDTKEGFSTVQLASFSALEENESITKLAQYFSYKREDEEGNLTYLNSDERYREAILYINELYREGLITDSNFTDTNSNVGANISNGRPFATFVTPQNYQSYFYNWNKNNPDKEYVPIVITNKDGEAPLLTNLAGTGYLYTMVSTNCKRPDRVMKLFDFLTSYEGQMLMLYGIEGETYRYAVRPGETADGKLYKYGKVEWISEEVASTVYAGKSVVTWGFDMEILTNRMLDNMVNPMEVSLRNLSSMILYNQKAPLIPYTYNPKLGAFVRDTQAKNYRDIVNKDIACKNLWIERATTIISQKTAEACEDLYHKTLALAETKGYKDVLAFDNVCFRNYKNKMGYTYTLPVYEEEYVAPEIKFRGFSEYLLEIPQTAWDAVN